MTVCILKPCEIRHNGALQQLKPGEYLMLPDKQEEKLVNAELARQTTLDDYRAMMKSFGRRAPGYSWEVIKEGCPEIWNTHMKAVRSGDIGTAIRTFNEMLQSHTTTNPVKGEKTNDHRQI